MPFLYIAYHHNWSGESDFRRHWLLLLTTERGSNTGTAYDVTQDEHEAWISRCKDNQDISASGTYQDKVVLGVVDDSKLKQLREIITEIALPDEGEDCQDWVKKAVIKLVGGKVLPSRAIDLMKLAPSN
jgi:hypothetical protein